MDKQQPLTFFALKLATVIALERKIGKLFARFEHAAFSPELSKALSPEGTECQQHQQRLALIKQIIKTPKTAADLSILDELLKFKLKKADPSQDLHMIGRALELQNLKLAQYELLHPLATKLDLEQVAILIEQTITDTRNSNTWLRQLIQNVVLRDMGS